MPEKHPIHAKYPEHHKSAVVEKAATQRRRRGERIPNEPGPKLEAWGRVRWECARHACGAGLQPFQP